MNDASSTNDEFTDSVASQESATSRSARPSHPSRRIEAVFPSVSGAGAEFVDMVVKELELRECSPQELFHAQLALDEAITNAIEHGNKFDPTKSVRVVADIDDSRALFSVQDEGPGFPFWDLPDPTQEENLDKPCGRGVFLIRNLMTNIHFNDVGNCLYMELRFPS